MINRRFLNFKTYNGFKEKLNQNQISNESIVFIQDRHCIWAQGKEYICDGPNSSHLYDSTLVFENRDGGDIFKISLNDNTLELEDSLGNKISATYILQSEFENWKTQIINTINQLPSVDSILSSTSTNPVLNKVIKEELDKKANLSTLEAYTDDNEFVQGLATKQNKLKAGRGISIEGDYINSTLDTEVYVMVDELPNPQDADPNKIYILETKVGNDYTYEQYRVKNNTWERIGSVAPTVDLTSYLTKNTADSLYQPIGAYATTTDLTSYAKASDVLSIAESLNSYATIAYLSGQLSLMVSKDYVDNTFVMRSEVYNPKQGNWGTNDESQSSGSSGNINTILVDSMLSLTSINPVLNAVITGELNNKATKLQLLEYATLALLRTKADVSSLRNYVTNSDLEDAVAGKQNRLTAGQGISIVDNVISTNLNIDTQVYLFVDLLPTTNIDDNKIYVVETQNNGETVYAQWKHKNNQWISIGQLQAEIDLTDYITTAEAEAAFAPKASYVTSSVFEQSMQDVADLYQPKGLYATTSYVDDTFLVKGNYLTPIDLNPVATKQELNAFKQLVEDTYVKIVSVYTPTDGTGGEGQSEPSDPNSGQGGSDTDPNQGGNVVGSRMVTLTTSQYEFLVTNNAVDPDTYYFTYEEEEQTTWGFGDLFPVILTDGSTPDSIGTFPINLS